MQEKESVSYFYWRGNDIIWAVSTEPCATLCMIIGIFFQVLEFLAQKGILTSKHIHEGPRFAGVERLDYFNLFILPLLVLIGCVSYSFSFLGPISFILVLCLLTWTDLGFLKRNEMKSLVWRRTYCLLLYFIAPHELLNYVLFLCNGETSFKLYVLDLASLNSWQMLAES